MNLNRTTQFSRDRRYRYTLWREWGDVPNLLFSDAPPQRGFIAWICLNPSTADELYDDPTVRRCINFTKSWGYQAMCMLNLFAFRATDPKVMKAHPHPTGPLNFQWIETVCGLSGLVVAAWGTHGSHHGNDSQVIDMLRERNIPIHCLKLTNQGYPAHPLYLRGNLKPERFA